MLIPIIGRACSGKSTKLYEHLNARALENKKCLLIVPEQFSFEAEKKVLEKTDPCAWKNTEVISFSFMAQKLVEKYDPRHLPFIGARGKSLLMSMALDDLWDRLAVYGAVKNRRRLVAELTDIDRQLKEACVSVDFLSEAAETAEDRTFAGKLHDVGLIIGAYRAAVETEYSDKSSLLHTLAELLRVHRVYADYVIALDDFSGFTAEELAVIEQLMQMSDEILITFCADAKNAPSGSCFDLPRGSYREILAAAAKQNVAVAAPLRCADTYYLCEELKHAEQFLFDLKPEIYEAAAKAVTVCKCDDRARECEYAAIAAKKLVRESGYRYRDIAVIERENGSYAPELAAAFRRHELPVFYDNRRSIACEAPVQYVLSLLENALVGFSSDAIMRMLRSGMTALDAEQIHAIDNYILMYDIDGGAWDAEWVYNPEGLGVAFTENARAALALLNDVRQAIVGEIRQFSAACEGQTCAGIAEAIYAHLTRTGAEDKLRDFASALAAGDHPEEADIVIAAWGELMECLSDLHDVIGARYLKPERFFELFLDAVTASTCGVAPTGLDEISIGAADRVRLSDVKAVILVGVNDGVFPGNIGVSGMFSDHERKTLAALGAPLGGDSDYIAARERYITYKACSYARETLIVTYAKHGSDGARLLPSELIENFEKILPYANYRDFDEVSPMDRLSGKEAAFRYLAENFLSDEPLITGLNAYFFNSGEQNRVNALERLATKTLPSFADPANARLLYGDRIRVSPSKMESFYTCQFRYFCKYGLYAKPRQKAVLTPAQNGLAVHYVLQRVFDEIGSGGLAAADSQTLHAVTVRFLDEYIDLFLPGVAQQSERMHYIVRSYITVIESVLMRLREEFRCSDFVTVDTELPIGDAGNGLPAYRVTDRNGDTVEIVGTVDRVDVFRRDGVCYLRVVDYKTGGKEFALSDAFQGLNTQMLIYLMCLWRNGSARYGGETAPAGILYIPTKIGEMSLRRDESAEKIKSQQMRNAQTSGLLLNDATVLRAMGADSKVGYLPAAVDDEDAVSGSVLTYGQFCRLHEVIDRKIAEMGEALRSGKIEPLPIGGEGHENVCMYCDYQSVCLHEQEDPSRELEVIPQDKLYAMLAGEESTDEQ